MKAVTNLYPTPGSGFFSHTQINPKFDVQIVVALGWSRAEIDATCYSFFMTFVEHAVERGFAKIGEHECSLTLSGYQYAEKVGLVSGSEDRIFVAMWFGEHGIGTYFEEAVRPAIKDAGYMCVRIDQTHHNERIDEQILAEIRKSNAVLVDMSCGLAKPEGWSKAELVGAPRGGVYFEAGFANGLGLPIIWTVKEELASFENVVHFDVRQFNQYRWGSDHEENRRFLRARIEATLGRGSYHQA